MYWFQSGFHSVNYIETSSLLPVDGAGFMTNADKFQLVYVEGSRPVAKQEKEISDNRKIINNLKSLFSKTVKELVKTRRRLPKKLFIFGGQSFRFYRIFIDNYRELLKLFFDS